MFAHRDIQDEELSGGVGQAALTRIHDLDLGPSDRPLRDYVHHLSSNRAGLRFEGGGEGESECR